MLLLKATSLGVVVAMEADPPTSLTVAVVTPLLEIKNPFRRALIRQGAWAWAFKWDPARMSSYTGPPLLSQV